MNSRAAESGDGHSHNGNYRGNENVPSLIVLLHAPLLVKKMGNRQLIKSGWYDMQLIISGPG